MTGLTAARVREFLSYDRLTGIFTWRVRRSNRAAGSVAGSPNADGYIQIGIDGDLYYAHRLAWFYVTGEWPVAMLDHRDTDKANNRFANLRQADRSLNSQNRRRARKDNKLGILGVRRMRNGPLSRPYAAEILAQGTPRHLGYYATAQEAHASYVAAKRIHHAGNTL